MKKKLSILTLAVALFFSVMMLGNSAKAEETKELDVMFLHDTHSHVNEFLTVENGKSQMMGGFAKIKTLINEQKEENPDTLLLDAGDFSMGTLIQVLFEEEAAEIRMLGNLGMDVTTLGNHEFDYRSRGLANMLEAAIESGDPLPEMVLCNVDWETMEKAGLTEEQQMLADAFERYGVKEYVVVEKGDVRIAVTGLFGLDSLDCAPTCTLLFKNPVEAAKETVAKIQKNEDVDMIVCVSHSGTTEDPDKSEDEILAREVPEIDLIISGHSHTKLEEAIVSGDTYIVSTGEYGKYLGSLSMTQKENGRWELGDYALLRIDDSVEKDKETQEKIDELMAKVDTSYLQQFGYTKDQVLCTNEVEFAENDDAYNLHTDVNLGSIMADSYTYAVEHLPDFDGRAVDVTVVPAGVIRDTFPLGNITTENVYHTFSLGIGEDQIPGYPLISVYLTGAELKTAAEVDANISDLMPAARLYTDGLCWNYNPNRMILNKVTDVYLRNSQGERVELEDDKLYRVVTDYYTSQMLGGVTELSYGLLSLVPKTADGTPIENYADAIIKTEGREFKTWVAIAQYMESFEDTDGDGIGNVPEIYGTNEGRKVAEDSKKIGDLLRSPNKFFFAIVGIFAVVILIFILLIVCIVKIIRHRKNKKSHS